MLQKKCHCSADKGGTCLDILYDEANEGTHEWARIGLRVHVFDGPVGILTSFYRSRTEHLAVDIQDRDVVVGDGSSTEGDITNRARRVSNCIDYILRIIFYIHDLHVSRILPMQQVFTQRGERPRT